MRGFVGIVAAIVILALLGGVAFLYFANPTPTPKVVEREIPGNRFGN